MDGSISIPRNIADSTWGTNPIIFYIFVRLVMKANWKDEEWHGVTISRGELITSVHNLAHELRLTDNQVKHALRCLQNDKRISIKSTNKFSNITICDYGSYQYSQKTESQTDLLATSQTKVNNRINKEINKEEKKDTDVSKEKLTPSEVAELWNSICTNLPSVQRMSEGRASKVRKRIKEFGEDDPRTFVENLFKTINSSDFLCGRVTPWKASFDWVFNNSENWVKVIEKKYNQDPQSLFSPTPQEPAAPLPPFIAETKEESLFLAANPTEEDIRKYVIDHIVIGHPKEDGETKEDYKRRMYDMFERDYKKDWIEYRVNFVTEHFYGK